MNPFATELSGSCGETRAAELPYGELVQIQPNRSRSVTAENDVGWSALRNLGELHIEMTAVCNLSCSYCYAEVLPPHRNFALFPIDLYRRTIELVATHSRKPHIEIIFHGGEPLLQSAEWYDEACSAASEILRTAGKTVEFGIQSNLVVLRDAHLDVFMRHGVKVGTSLDGPQEIHDAVRGKFGATVRNMRRLMEGGIFSGAIAVVHHHNWHIIREIYRTYFALGIRAFHLNVASAVGHGRGSQPLSEDQIYRVLCDNMDSMIEYDGEMVETRLLAKIKRYVAMPSREVFLSELKCDNPFCHAGINMVVVKFTGELYPCGCAGSSGNIQRYLLGNINEPGLHLNRYKSQIREFHAKTEKYERECRLCPARFVCEHGCPAFDINDPVTPEHHCAATKRFHAYIGTLPQTTLERVASFSPKPWVLVPV